MLLVKVLYFKVNIVVYTILGENTIKTELIIISAFIILFLSLTCVSASDDSNNTACNFTQLNNEINNASDEVKLTNDYVHVLDDDNVTISKSIKINGNGHKINGKKSTIIFNITNDSNVIFENITFTNTDVFGFNLNSTLNLTFINCNFDEMYHASLTIGFPHDNVTLSYSGKISSKVKNLAKKIVGSSSGWEAARKLAKWVGKNINHETAPGFYQTPEMTLERKRGNCCSQTDLFLQMCAAVGLNKNHKLYYVHVGTMEFHHRHFFAMFDNYLVDVDSYHKFPWGHALIESRDIYRVTPYPLLPLTRQY